MISMKDQAQSSSDDEKRLRVVHAGAEGDDTGKTEVKQLPMWRCFQHDANAYRNSTRLIL